MTAATQEIPIEEVTRRTVDGLMVYVRYKGRVLRRRKKRGRPHYEAVRGIEPHPADRVRRRRVNVNSQVARALLADLSKLDKL